MARKVKRFITRAVKHPFVWLGFLSALSLWLLWYEVSYLGVGEWGAIVLLTLFFSILRLQVDFYSTWKVSGDRDSKVEIRTPKKGVLLGVVTLLGMLAYFQWSTLFHAVYFTAIQLAPNYSLKKAKSQSSQQSALIASGVIHLIGSVGAPLLILIIQWWRG